jgi:hypothetical protein
MRFKLLVHKKTKALTTFHVTDQTGAVVGSVSVPPSEANDLQKCWLGAHRDPTARGAAAAARPGVKPVKLPQLSRKAILRGC